MNQAHKKEKFLLVGSGGREGAIAASLAKDTEVYAVIDHPNPTIIDHVEASGGKYLVHNTNDGQAITEFALAQGIDYAFISADAPLSNGVVDTLISRQIKAVGGTKAASRIEWDKIYSIELMNRVCPSFTPSYRIVSNRDELHQSLNIFRGKNKQVVVKPQGLTGGKGVKVMPEHLKDYEACEEYVIQLFKERPEERVLLVEKLHGVEFTVMGFTDGETLAIAPATYDYPFRLENDKGPGTGGMGCFTGQGMTLPFMTDHDLMDCRHVMQRVVNEMKRQGVPLKGVLNGGFFKTNEGIQFMEFNARLGDPEAISVLSLLSSPLAEVVRGLWHGTLTDQSMYFSSQASVVKYLVAEEYPEPSPTETVFSLDEEAIRARGVDLFASACVREDKGKYRTLKKSRVLALGAVAASIEQGSTLINQVLEKHFSGSLCYRADVGSAENLQLIRQRLA